MKTRRRLITWGYIIAAGWFVAVNHAKGEALNYISQVKAQESQYKTPEDMISLIPVLGKLPRTFLMGDGYTMKLTPTQLRIDHMGQDSRSNGKQRTCMLGLSYSTPVAGFFTSRIDVPLFHAPALAMSDWSRSSLGDYVVYMSRTPVDHASLKLAFSARF